MATRTAAAPTPTVSTPPPLTPTKVKVSIDRNWEITSTHPLPNPNRVLAVLPSKYTRGLITTRATQGYDIRTIVALKIVPKQIMSDAIAEAILLQLGEVEKSESVLSALASNGYLALGEGLYKLSCVGVGSTNRALTAMRKSIMEKCNAQAKQITADATAAANALIISATNKESKADKILSDAQASGKLIPPKWAVDAGLPVMWQIAFRLWAVGITVPILIKSVVYRRQIYDANTNVTTIRYRRWNKSLPINQPVTRIHPAVTPHPVLIWVPLRNASGEYAATSLSVDHSHYVLPHIKHESACMALPNAPKEITDTASANQLRDELTRVFSTIDAHDLYTSYIRWSPSVQAMLHADLRAAFALSAENPDAFHKSMFEGIKADETEDIDATKDDTSTWVAPATPPTRA